MTFTFHQANTGTKLLAQLSQPPAQALEQIAQSLPKDFEHRFRSMKNRQSVLEQRQVRHFCTDRIDRVEVLYLNAISWENLIWQHGTRASVFRQNVLNFNGRIVNYRQSAIWRPF